MLLRIFKVMQIVGFILTLIGTAGLILGFAGLINVNIFAFGITAGVRVVGTLAVTGCLLGAVGCFGLEYNNARP